MRVGLSLEAPDKARYWQQVRIAFSWHFSWLTAGSAKMALIWMMTYNF